MDYYILLINIYIIEDSPAAYLPHILFIALVSGSIFLSLNEQ